MNIVLSSFKFSPGQKVVIDKDNIGGRHLRLSDGSGLIYVNAGARCTVKECLLNDWVIVEVDETGWICEVDSKNLSRFFESKPQKNNLFTLD